MPNLRESLAGAPRARAWAERLGALLLGVVLLNVNVTDAGDALSSVSGPPGTAQAGITPESKALLYVVLALVGTSLALWSTSQALRSDVLARRFRSLGSPGALLAAAGVAGLALDHRDGPVRTVQLVVYVMLSLAAIRAVGLAVAISRNDASSVPRRR